MVDAYKPVIGYDVKLTISGFKTVFADITACHCDCRTAIGSIRN